MKRVVIVGSGFKSEKNDPNTIKEAIESQNLLAEVIEWEELIFSVKGGAVSLDVVGHDDFTFEGVDLVVCVGWYRSGKQSMYRDVAFSLALYLESISVPFWNSEMHNQRSTTKASCMVQLALAGIPVPDTIFSINTEAALLRANDEFVIKAASASRGKDNYLVTSRNQVPSLSEGVLYIIQPFLPNDHDLRIICYGGKPSLALRRSRGDDSTSHLNNTSQGGRAEWLKQKDLPQEILTISEKTCRIMRRELAGIDFIPDQASPFGYSCLEVNAIPQLTSGTDTELKLATLQAAIEKLG